MAKVQQQAPARSTGGERAMAKRVCSRVCLAVVFISSMSVIVEGIPIRGPDLDHCQGVWPHLRPVPEPMDCCLTDPSKPIKDFKFDLDLPMRVRKPVHKIDTESVRKYERAVELLRSLPPEDPRSYLSQSKLHCSYCSGAYNQFNTTMVLSVHLSWLFFPFHRMFTYFHERILAKLIGDDTFAIPYWAWDIQNEYYPAANVLPLIFANKSSSLHDVKRSRLHQYPHRVDLQYNHNLPDQDPDVLWRENYNAIWQSMIGQARSLETFYGGKLHEGEEYHTANPGQMENGPHAAVHFWTGDYENNYGEDMAPAYAAARDPIFFTHHSQIDRLWLMWKSWGGGDYDDLDWLDAQFLFYDENADLVRVKVRDSLNLTNLRISYDLLEPDWVNYTPKSIRDTDPQYAQAGILRRFWRQLVSGGTYGNVAMFLGSLFKNQVNGVEVSLGGARRETVTSRVSRPELFRSTADSLAYEEVLVITGVVEKPFSVSVLINMFLELPEADENTPRYCVEFLGGVSVEAEGFPPGTNPFQSRKFKRAIGVSDALQRLGITHQKSVTVTFVPIWDSQHDPDVLVRITDLKVEKKWAGRHQ